jgi:hypothetical protein
VKMWDAFQWISGAEVKYLRDFAFSIGKRYEDLEPDADLVSPDKNYDLKSYEGWAYCARTPDKKIFLAYFEVGMPKAQIRGALLNADYRVLWFDPRNGSWKDAGVVRSSTTGTLDVPDYPTKDDWALKFVAADDVAQKSR